MNPTGQLFLCRTFGLKTSDRDLCAKRRAARSGSGKSRHHRFPGCLECGAELEAIESADQSFTPPPPAADPPKIEEENMATTRKCPSCGEVKEILRSGYCLECQRTNAREAYHRKAAKQRAGKPAARSLAGLKNEPASQKSPPRKQQPPWRDPETTADVMKKLAEENRLPTEPAAALAPLNADAERLAAAQGPRIIITGRRALEVSAYILAAKAEPQVRQQYELMIGHAMVTEEPAS